LRAFLNGQLDLSQAEAVADLIASDSQASHQLAMQQMRGGFSTQLQQLREELIHFASMIELELDFAEEDVEFANRDDLKALILKINAVLHKLIQSFEQGNVLKTGVPVVIAGWPNVGKSTLLNTLLNEERAIVSEIAGTTRDTIEDELTINGIVFRFIDTAGIRVTQDTIEAIGVERTHEKMKQAKLILYLVSPDQPKEVIEEQLLGLETATIPFLTILNKADMLNDSQERVINQIPLIRLSAKEKTGIEELKKAILEKIQLHNIAADEVLISNTRHLEALQKTESALTNVLYNLDTLVTSDFISSDIKQALYYLGEITGLVTTDDLLENIFSKFCIGK
jgi:tRNA modification GTPase